MTYWYTPHLRQPIKAHAVSSHLGIHTLCGEFIGIYRLVDSDPNHNGGRDERCEDCVTRLDHWERFQLEEGGM